MPQRKISDGATYKFNGVPGDNDDVAPLGADANALFPGQVVSVRETVAADEPGAHDDSEDAVVIEWEQPSLVRGENGWEQGMVTRAMSIGVDQFNDQFEEA